VTHKNEENNNQKINH